MAMGRVGGILNESASSGSSKKVYQYVLMQQAVILLGFGLQNLLYSPITSKQLWTWARAWGIGFGASMLLALIGDRQVMSRVARHAD